MMSTGEPKAGNPDMADELELPRFAIGDLVEKGSGYRFPGIVTAHDSVNANCYVVTADHPDFVGMKHIFHRSQLIARISRAPIPADAVTWQARCEPPVAEIDRDWFEIDREDYGKDPLLYTYRALYTHPEGDTEPGDLVERLTNDAAEADTYAGAGENVDFVEPAEAWGAFAKDFREAASALSSLRAERDAYATTAKFWKDQRDREQVKRQEAEASLAAEKQRAAELDAECRELREDYLRLQETVIAEHKRAEAAVQRVAALEGALAKVHDFIANTAWASENIDDASGIDNLVLAALRPAETGEPK